MKIDNSSAVSAVNTIKGYVADCFSKCTEKGSTFSGENKLRNLESAIDLIPTGSGGGSGGAGSGTITSNSFSGFTVITPEEVYNEETHDYDTPNYFTLDLTGTGVETNFKYLACFDDDRGGYFIITKVTEKYCLLASRCCLAYWGEDSTSDDGTMMEISYEDAKYEHFCEYTVSGNTIKIEETSYPLDKLVLSDGIWNNDNHICRSTTQVDKKHNYKATTSRDYFQDYGLRKITVEY